MSDYPTNGAPASHVPLNDHANPSPLGTGNYPPAPGGDATGPSEKADAVKEQASGVAGDAKDAAGHVADVTKEQAAQVTSEVKAQAKDLYAQATSELKDQAGTQAQKVSEGLRSVSDELTSMADKSDGNGLASELVRNLSSRAGSAASWLDGRDPGTLLDDVKQFAARKPGTFIAIAAGAGILAGRLAKSLAAEAKNDTSSAAKNPAAVPPSTAQQDAFVPRASESDASATPTFDDLLESSTPSERPFGEQ